MYDGPCHGTACRTPYAIEQNERKTVLTNTNYQLRTIRQLQPPPHSLIEPLGPSNQPTKPRTDHTVQPTTKPSYRTAAFTKRITYPRKTNGNCSSKATTTITENTSTHFHNSNTNTRIRRDQRNRTQTRNSHRDLSVNPRMNSNHFLNKKQMRIL